jgi:2-oxoglutarate ferredoxin oxidoreductase subunit delta
MTETVLVHKIVVVDRLCKGCGICVDFCPFKVLEMSIAPNSRVVVKNEIKCTKCGVCEIMCPDFAIFVVR